MLKLKPLVWLQKISNINNNWDKKKNVSEWFGKRSYFYTALRMIKKCIENLQ